VERRGKGRTIGHIKSIDEQRRAQNTDLHQSSGRPTYPSERYVVTLRNRSLLNSPEEKEKNGFEVVCSFKIGDQRIKSKSYPVDEQGNVELDEDFVL
jgi:hypothetical protein